MTSTSKKIGIAVACIVVAFLVTAVFVAPRVFDLNQYRPAVISYIEQQTGRRVEIGHLALRILPEISIQVDRFALSNPAGFPSGDWLRIKRIRARLDFGALLHRQIVLRTLSLQGPVVELLSDAQGRWNFQVTPPPGPVKLAPGDPAPFLIHEIVKLTLAGGEFSARKWGVNGDAGPSVWEADGVSLALGEIGSAELNEIAGLTPSALDAGASRKQPAAAPPAPHNTTGQVSVASLHIAGVQVSRIKAKLHLSPAGVDLDDLHYSLYGGSGRGAASVKLGGPLVRYQAQTQLSGVSVQKLLNDFPSARGQMTGTLEAQATLSGEQRPPASALGGQGHGSVIIRKGQWPKFKLDQTLVELAKLAQLGPASGDLSQFSSISADWRLNGSIITASNVRMVGNGTTVIGSGTVDLAQGGRLNFDGVAEIAARRNLLSNFLANASGASFKQGRIDVPFVVQGVLKKPVFRLKAGSLFTPAAPASGSPKTAQPNLLKGLMGLIHNKKAASRK